MEEIKTSAAGHAAIRPAQDGDTRNNWQPGDDVIVRPPGSCGTAKERVEAPAADTTVLDWFMVLKKCPK
jgi:peroxiredoxin (alkyl hydroperoxide reductase subunit C)